jgi:hypothetical protein
MFLIVTQVVHSLYSSVAENSNIFEGSKNICHGRIFLFTLQPCFCPAGSQFVEVFIYISSKDTELCGHKLIPTHLNTDTIRSLSKEIHHLSPKQRTFHFHFHFHCLRCREFWFKRRAEVDRISQLDRWELSRLQSSSCHLPVATMGNLSDFLEMWRFRFT